VKQAGGIRSANADMSNEKRVKSPLAESPRVPAQRSSAQGESAPKVRPKGVADGKPVNNPVLLLTAMGGRRRLGQPAIGSAGLSV
jgi:hypothetical protein